MGMDSFFEFISTGMLQMEDCREAALKSLPVLPMI